MCAHLRSTVSHVPSPELSEGTDENAKMTPAQTSTGSQREAMEGHGRVRLVNGRHGEGTRGEAGARGARGGRPRRCERRAPPPPRHWRKPGRRRRGSLESEDLPAALHIE